MINTKEYGIIDMQNEMKWIETIQGILAMLSMILLMLVVRDDVKLFSITATKDKVFFELWKSNMLLTWDLGQ
ncbi:MAG: hypothetical protein J6D02_05235 [Lachnospira sp.]|nr:hypothetical protein [Lachnospira sp.]